MSRNQLPTLEKLREAIADAKQRSEAIADAKQRSEANTTKQAQQPNGRFPIDSLLYDNVSDYSDYSDYCDGRR